MSDIDDLIFSDALPPEQKDDAPATNDVLSCEVCGTSLTYAGRGRKPKRCPEHRKQSGNASGKRATPNDKLAREATEALVQINRLTGLGSRILGLPTTAEMIAFCEESFREQAYAALLTDPDLCRQILSAGQISAKFSLAIAYAMMGAQVVPVAVMEIKAKREAKAEAKALEDDSEV